MRFIEQVFSTLFHRHSIRAQGSHKSSFHDPRLAARTLVRPGKDADRVGRTKAGQLQHQGRKWYRGQIVARLTTRQFLLRDECGVVANRKNKLVVANSVFS